MGVREQFIQEILSWEDTPYVIEGCVKGSEGGSNCSYFLLDAITKVLPNADLLKEAYEWSHKRLFLSGEDKVPEFLKRISSEVPLKQVQPGDIVLFSFRGVSTLPAVNVGNDFYIFCNTGAKRIVKDYLPIHLYKRVTMALRPRYEEIK